MSRNKVREQVREQMAAMAAHDYRFRVVYDFFQELYAADEKGYVQICRTKMPIVAEFLVKCHPALGGTEMITAMQRVHSLPGEAVVHLSALVLKCIVDSVEAAMKENVNDN